MSPKARMLAGFALANIVILIVALALIRSRPETPPIIQGVLIPEARSISSFELIDHHNRPFSNDNLKGRWHLVTYGFTTCPDICPTTLTQLVQVSKKLQEQGHQELSILFYTVDHRRDTVAQMASYVPFFDTRFLGLTHLDDSENPHLPFEKSLGIVALLTPNIEEGVEPSPNDYQVSHGVTLFLINPQGKLQAIFEPRNKVPGIPSFEPDQVLRDYLAIRNYLG